MTRQKKTSSNPQLAFSSIDILSLETRAARVAATLDARPELGAIWRRISAVIEASSSLSLEDIRVPETDILGPDLGLGVIQGEPQSAHTANAIYRTLLRPGTLLVDPGAAFDRYFTAARMTSLVDIEDGGRVEYPDGQGSDDWRDARDTFARHAPAILRLNAPILLRALGVARLAAMVAQERHPAAERMIFMAAEGDLRRDLALSDPIISQPVPGLETRITGGWVYLPSISLSTNGFRAWSPFTRSGWSDLIERLDRTMAREAGRIGQIQTWMTRLDASFAGQTRRSRRGDLAQLMKETPILGSEVVARRLKITQRAARNLIEDACGMGLLTEITDRHHYRLYAVPPLAELIADRSGARRELRPQTLRDRPQREVPLRENDDGFEARMANIMGEIDAALSGLDAALERHRASDLRRLDG